MSNTLDFKKFKRLTLLRTILTRRHLSACEIAFQTSAGVICVFPLFSLLSSLLLLRESPSWLAQRGRADEARRTAKELGLIDGDWAWIETQHGRVMQKVQTFEGIDPRVVHGQHGWWYPEMPGEEPWLHGVWVSNINVCTSSDEEECDEALGSWPLRTFQCKVYKVKSYGEGHPVTG